MERIGFRSKNYILKWILKFNLLILKKKIVYIEEDTDGSLNLSDLEKKLRVYTANKDDKRVKIGSFCAASNVTGIINDVDKICMMYDWFSYVLLYKTFSIF